MVGLELGRRLDRRVAMHLQQSQTQLVRIFQHPLLAAVAPADHLFGAVERPVEQHELQALVRGGYRLPPPGAERRVALAPPVGDADRHTAAPARLGYVAGLAEYGQESAGLGGGPVPRRRFAHLRLLRPDQRQPRLAPHFVPPTSKRAAPLLVAGPTRNSALFLS